MLYELFAFLQRTLDPPGFQVFQFITVRASLAALTALVIALFAGRRIIVWLERQQLGERVRTGTESGSIDHAHKAGTPTMGGLIILLSLLGSVLLWGDLTQPYVWLAMGATAWMGAVGFADDYIKTVRKQKDGLSARAKIAAQVGIGIVVGSVLYFTPAFAEYNSLTYVPFFKNRTLDYYFFRDWVSIPDLGWLIYIPVVTFIMTAVSNAVNLTDGLDGLATGVTAFVSLGLMALVYVSGNINLATFLNVMYLPGTGELTVFCAAMTAACFGFLWYNGYPASVFMGDTGALALGAAVGAVTLMVRKELLLPLLGIVYFAEALSVILQTSYFKYTRRKTGTGKRIFRMAPLHHHYELKGWPEPRVIVRFWIVTVVLVLFGLASLKIR